MNLSSFPKRKLIVFALLSGADFMLTYYLVGRAGAGVYESNPVASWWLGHFGWAGLAAFKAAAVGVTVSLALVVWVRRPQAAHRILTFGGVAAATVVLYGCYLARAANGPRDVSDPREQAACAATERRLDELYRQNQSYRAIVTRVSADLAAGRCTLSAAADRLAQTEQAADAAWLRGLQTSYHGLNARGALAASAVSHALLSRDCTHADPLARRLLADLRDLCGVEVDLQLVDGFARASAPASAWLPSTATAFRTDSAL